MTLDDRSSEQVPVQVDDDRQLRDRRAERSAYDDEPPSRRVRLDVCLQVLGQVIHVDTISESVRIPKNEASR